MEERDGCAFVGLDVGWNAMGERFIYHSLLDVVLCRAADAPAVRDVTISGHINEGDDLFAEGSAVPRRRGGRHRRGDQRGQLQRLHDVGALSATRRPGPCSSRTGSDGYARRDVRMSESATLIRAGRLIDVDREEVVHDRVIVVEGDRIADVVSEAPAETSSATIDLSGHTVLPGPDRHARAPGRRDGDGARLRGPGHAVGGAGGDERRPQRPRDARGRVHDRARRGHVPRVRRLRAARRDRGGRHARPADDVRRRVRHGLGRRRRRHRARARRRRRRADRPAVRGGELRRRGPPRGAADPAAAAPTSSR